MNKNLTEIVFILDRSGSMSGLESDTIGGFNAMIEKQKKAPGEALVSTIGVKSVWRSARGFALRPSCLLTETSNSSSEQKMLAFSFGVIMF